MISKKNITLISLGCSKNLVDSEKLLSQFDAIGYNITFDNDPPKDSIVVINTCGFIGDAKEESVNTILNFASLKNKGLIKSLYVMGCLSQRYKRELTEEIPEVDKFYGKFDWVDMITDLGLVVPKDKKNLRYLTTPSHYAYVKIAEGCDRNCSYCAIPIITGHYKSRTIEDILSEIEYLVSIGVKEFQLIAQDLSFYGRDLYKKSMISELVEKISDIPGVEWIRLHYTYPFDFPYDLLRVIKERDNVCNYLDMALQHISDNVLKKMRRHITKNETYDIIKGIRTQNPDISLRTTLMVGHPGETDEDFEELLDFVKWAKFERMGAFKYCEEDGTFSALNYKDDVTPDIKEYRYNRLMEVQREISIELNEKKIGKVFKTIIDREEESYYVGRTEYDSPEVDSEVYINKDSESFLTIGDFYNVEIISAGPYDLSGKVIK